MGAVKETNPPRQGQYLTFYVAGEEYAINILKVKEILNTTRSQWKCRSRGCSRSSLARRVSVW